MIPIRTEPVTWIAPYVPDSDILEAIGMLALRHSHLDHILRMTIKSLTGLTVDAALFQHRKTKTWRLRQEIEQEARNRLGDGDDLKRLIDILERCNEISNVRNKVMHDPWLIHLSEPQIGVQVMLSDELEYVDVPKLREIQNIAGQAEAMFAEINDARLNGWLAAAIKRAAEAICDRDESCE